MKKLLLLFAVFASLLLKAEKEISFTHYTGLIGEKYPVEVSLTRYADKTLDGYYRYTKSKGCIAIRGRMRTDSTFILQEAQGQWLGKIEAGGVLSGTWTSGDQKRSLSFRVMPGGGVSGTYVPDTAYSEVKKKGEVIGSGEVELVNIRFSGKRSVLLDSIEKYVKEGLSMADWLDENNKSVQHPNATLFARQFADEAASTAEYDSVGNLLWTGGSYSFTAVARIAWNLGGIVCLEISSGGYTGGAHGWYNTSYYCFRETDGKCLTTDDLFTKGYAPALTKLVDASVRSYQGDDHNDCIEPEVVEPNGNFIITAEGISFFYNIYEISPYVCGTFEGGATWSELSQWIDPKGILGWVK